MNIAKFLRTTIWIGNLRWLLLTVLSQYDKVIWVVCSLVSRLHVLSSRSKTSTKRCTNNSLQSRSKTISFLLDSEYVLQKHWLLSILMKNLHEALHKELCNITFQKTFFACTSSLIKCFQFLDIIWKTEKCCVSKNMAVKIPILILFCFCLLCWLPPVSIVAASCFNYIGPRRWF